jgi:hypothetical protein
VGREDWERGKEKTRGKYLAVHVAIEDHPSTKRKKQPEGFRQNGEMGKKA